MSVQVFFNKPLRSINLQRLYSDMKSARCRLVLASAWFTDTDIADAFIDSLAEQKTVIFNAADMDRGTRKAYEMIKSYFNNPVQWWNDEDENEDENEDGNGVFSIGSEKYGIDDNCYVDVEKARFRFAVLGSGNWSEGVMHHKFILCDDVVWVGSYNFTYQARKNYETLLRIDDKSIAQQFYDEVEALVFEPSVGHFSIITNGIFSCDNCEKRFIEQDMGLQIKGSYHQLPGCICKYCVAKYYSEEQLRFLKANGRVVVYGQP